MKMINEQEIFETWSPIIESKTNIKDSNKVEWLTKYCHYHSLNENAATFPQGFATLDGIPGQGAPLAPTRTAYGSGDKFPSLLPLAIQVAAKTVGFDIVPVIPMPGPTGVLTYLDYVYAGGKTDSAQKPTVIKAGISGTYTVGSTYTVSSGGNSIPLTFVGKSRIDGYPIFKVGTSTPSTLQIATVFATGSVYTLTDDLAATITTNVAASLVSALEDHVAGFTGAGDTDASNWEGPYSSNSYVGPMTRETGESTYYRSMGLKTFTKFVEAKTYQAAASVTTEQIQDLNKQFGIDVVSMVENALVNEVSQSINKHILGNAFALGATNSTNFAATEGQSLNLNLGSLPTVGTFENQSTFQRRIFSRILAAANVVANRGRRGPANFIVCNSQIATALQDISQFVTAPFANTISQNNGSLYPVGSLAGLTCYVDQNMKWNDTRVLVGRKGTDDEPGLKFMPYMMAESIQTIAEGSMSPKIAVKSRYALVEAGFRPETMYFTFTVTLPSAGLIV